MSHRRKFKLSRARARAPHDVSGVSFAVSVNLWWPPVLHADSIRKRVSVPDPALTSSHLATIPSRGEIHSSLHLLFLLHRRRYSFKRLVFPVGTRQPQQRHEKRLINKLIRFLPTLRRTPFISNLSLFFLRKRLSRFFLSLRQDARWQTPLGFRKRDTTDSNPTHVSLAR